MNHRPFARRALGVVPALVLLTGLFACNAAPAGPLAVSDASPLGGEQPDTGAEKTEIVVMGMLHGKHRTSRHYGVGRIKEMIRNIDPDYVLTEIPPDRIAKALADFNETGTVMEPRVGRFPEYTDALFPLTKEMDFEIVPCAAWTRPMADARSAKLAKLQGTQPEESAELQAAMKAMEDEIRSHGLGGHPKAIHTEKYDEITRRGMETYARLFDDELGAGGWTAINKAHCALILKAIETRRGQGGKRFLITFGAGHKYWILDAVKGLDGVVVRNPLEFDPEPGDQPP
jgi:hypothetical protein